jgi:hypothetical protein
MVIELVGTDGVLLRRDVIAAGHEDKQLRALVRSEVLTRIRQGAYARVDTWKDLDETDRHRMLSSAVTRQYPDDIALSHGSAVLRAGGPSHGLDLESVHILHLDSTTGRRNVAGVVHHQGEARVLDVTRFDDCWSTSPARTIIDVTLQYGFEVGVVVADDFLHRGLTTKPELWQLYEHMKAWPGALVVRLVIGFADGASESVGESLGRLLFRRLGLPTPELQYRVTRPDGSLAGRTDWAWPKYRTLGEFDGLSKYSRWLRPGETAAEAVLREKRREDELRELTGWHFIRLVWPDLFKAEQTARRLLAVLSRAV